MSGRMQACLVVAVLCCSILAAPLVLPFSVLIGIDLPFFCNLFAAPECMSPLSCPVTSVTVSLDVQ